MGRGLKFFIIFLFLTFLLACSSTSKIKTELFNTEGLQVGSSSIQKQGFIPMRGIDVPILKKESNDTLVMLEMNTRFDAIHTKTWRIKMDSTNTNFNNNVSAIFSKGYIRVFESLGQSNANKNSSFYGYSDVDNKVFICNFFKEEDQDYLDISYYVPVLSKWKVKRKKKIFNEEKKNKKLKNIK